MRGVEEEPWEGYLVRPYNIFLFVRVCIKNVTENPIPILVQNATASVGLSNAASGLAASGPYPNFCRAELEHPRNDCGGSPRTLPAVTMLSQKDGGRDVTPWALRRVESVQAVITLKSAGPPMETGRQTGLNRRAFFRQIGPPAWEHRYVHSTALFPRRHSGLRHTFLHVPPRLDQSLSATTFNVPKEADSGEDFASCS